MAINLHLQNLSVLAANMDVRRFFMHYDIPEGGVFILGGPNGDAFISFRHDSDLLKAISLSGQHLLGQPVKLRIISRMDMEQIIETRKAGILGNKQMVTSEPTFSNSGADRYPIERRDDDNTYMNPYFDSIDKSNQDYKGDLKQTNLGRGLMDLNDSFPQNSQGLGLGYETDRERRQVNVDMSRDRWDNGQYEIGIDLMEDRDDRREKRRQLGIVDTVPGYVRLDNLPSSIGLPELEDLCKYYNMRVVMPGGIIRNQVNGDNSAFIKLSSQHDALRADALGEVEMQGYRVHIRIISKGQYDNVNQEVMYHQPRQEHYDQFPENQFQGNNFGLIPESQYQGRNQAIMQAGYIRIRNLPGTMWYKELRAFFRGHDMGSAISKSFITIKQDLKHRRASALIEFSDYQSALSVMTLDNIVVEGQALIVEMISQNAYNEEKDRWAVVQGGMQKNLVGMNPRAVGQGSMQTNFFGLKPWPVGQGNMQKNLGMNPQAVRQGSMQKNLVGKNPQPGYIRIRNLPSTVTYKMLREFLKEQNIIVAKNAIFLRRDDEISTAFILCPNNQVAQRAASLKNHSMEGQMVTIEKISVNTYNEGKNIPRVQIDSGIQKKGLPKEQIDSGIQKKGQPKGQIKSGIQKKGQPMEMPDNVNSSSMHYAMIHNLSPSVKFKEVKAFFREFALVIGRNGIFLKFGEHSNTAYLKFSSLPDGLKIDSLDCGMLEGNDVKIEIITADVFEQQKSSSPEAAETQPKTSVNLQSTTSPTDKLHYFIKFDELADDATACEIWDWFGGAEGKSKGVRLVRQVDNGNALFAYVEFGNLQDRNAAMAENEPCTPVSANETYRHLAGVGPLQRIFEATKAGRDREMLEGQIVHLTKKNNADPPEVTLSKSAIFSDLAERANAEPGNSKFLCFMRVSDMAANASPWRLWQQYGGADGTCKGVVVMRRRDDHNALCTMFAFMAFGDRAHRDAALKVAGVKRKWHARATFQHLAQLESHCSIIECTIPGKDHELSKTERALLSKIFSVDKNKESNAKIIAKKPKNVSTAENSEKASAQQSIFSQLILGANSPAGKQLSFIRIIADAMPENATAAGMCRWLSKPNAASKGGILVRKSMGDEGCAFIAFEGKAHSREALEECEGAMICTAASSRRKIASYGSEYDIFESTEMGDDSKVSEEKRKELQRVTPLEVVEIQPEGKKRKAQDTKIDEEINKKMKL